jgi:hypothetical protein
MEKVEKTENPSIAEQLSEIRRKYPEAWGYIEEMMEYKKMEGEQEANSPLKLPHFDDNDEMIWGE